MAEEERQRNLEQQVTEIHTILKRIERMMDEHDRWINGYNGEDGAKVRLDRIEQTHRRQKWIVSLICIPVLGGIAKFFLTLIGK